jgi:NAD(P)-dependent dehydrogenase (short-subunit alcohol dehydrogenase family)
VTDRNGDELLGAMQADLMPHVHAVRHLLPLLQDNVHARRYVMIGSPANAKPWAGYGETSITTAALRMYAQVVHQEAQALGVRAQMLEVCSPVCTPANAANACIEWPSSLLVGRRVVSLLDGAATTAPSLRQQRCRTAARPAAPGSPRLWRDTAGVA